MSKPSDLDFEDFDVYLRAQNGKIIHQVWFGTIPNKRSAKKTYDKLKRYRDSWKIKNPDWCHIEWNKDMCVDLIKNLFPEHEEMFKKYDYEIQRCDTIRYFILYRYGGLYADMDYYCNRPWDEVLRDYPGNFYLVQTPNRTSKTQEYVSNSLMYSKPNHPFWRYLFLELEKNYKSPIYYTRHMAIMFSTGPGIVNRMYMKRKRKHRLNSYPHKLFHPYGIGDDKMFLQQNKEVYAIHLGKGTWEKKDSKIFLLFFREWKFLLFIILVLSVPGFFSQFFL